MKGGGVTEPENRGSRAADQLRPVRITRNFTETTPGSVMMEAGKTMVLAAAAVERRIPPWMKEGTGWVTAEYSMMPGSSANRVRRDRYTSGRSREISRLIGRSLRSVVDLRAMGEMTVTVDCDVIQADGGTRTAAVTAGWVALHDALAWAEAEGMVASSPLTERVAAVSVGLVEGEARLDLDYELDAAAAVDMNVVMTGEGRLVEVQGTAEGAPFSRGELEEMLDLAAAGINRLGEAQREAVGWMGR